MRLHLLEYWHRIRSGFWFLPTAMALGSIGLSMATVALDSRLAAGGTHVWSWVYNGGAEGASAVLTAVSGSMITIAGLVFSLTLVAMSLAASNFGPRLLQNFMRDTANQVVLGTFVATFLYCLLVLRTIRRPDEIVFVPHVSVSLGVLLALTSIGVLIYFIHHVATSIQADEIIARVAQELCERVDSLYPERMGREANVTLEAAVREAVPPPFESEALPVPAPNDGYVQLIDDETLMTLARRENAIFRVERRPGQYVVAGKPLVRIWPASRRTETLAKEVAAAFALGNQRTADQDIGYPIGQLVEIAVRALSPGINDPFTAMTCVDRLGSALCRLARRDSPSSLRYDETNSLRIIAPGATFEEVSKAAFDPIRRYGAGSAEVSLRLLDSLAVVADCAWRGEDLAILQRQASLVFRSRRDLAERTDRREVQARYAQVSTLIRKRSVHLAGSNGDSGGPRRVQ